MSKSALVVLSSANRRGAEIQGSSLAIELKARGTAATAVALSPPSSGAAIDIPVLGPSPMSLATLRELRRRAKHASLVIGYGSWTLPACTSALAGARVPFLYRSIGDPRSWVRGPSHRFRTGLMFRHAQQIAALWPGAADSIELLYSVPADRLSVIPNARSAEYFHPPTPVERDDARSMLGLDHDARVVVAIGALSDEKRVDLAVNAVVGLPDVHLLVAGEGPCRSAVEVAAARAPDRIHLLGPVADVRPLLHASDVVVLTSSTEGMPGVLIEGALCGIPAVATDVGATSYALGDGGVLIPPGADLGEMSAAIERVLGDADRLGANARSRSLQYFTWDTIVPLWQDVIEGVVTRAESR